MTLLHYITLSSNEQECILVGCVLPVAEAVTGGTPHTLPLEQACPLPPEQTPDTPWVWARRPPTGCGPGTPQPDPPQLPPWVWAWRPHWSDPPQLPLGCGPGNLQSMLGYHPLPQDLSQGMLGYCLQCMLEYNPPPPTVNRMTDRQV